VHLSIWITVRRGFWVSCRTLAADAACQPNDAVRDGLQLGPCAYSQRGGVLLWGAEVTISLSRPLWRHPPVHAWESLLYRQGCVRAAQFRYQPQHPDDTRCRRDRQEHSTSACNQATGPAESGRCTVPTSPHRAVLLVTKLTRNMCIVYRMDCSNRLCHLLILKWVVCRWCSLGCFSV